MDWDKLERDAYSYLNLTPHELYEFTHREYTNMMEGYHLRREHELKDLQFQAWHNALYVGMAFSGKELPDLKELMANKEPETPLKPMSEEERWTQSRSTLIKLKQAGIHVPVETLKKYNLNGDGD